MTSRDGDRADLSVLSAWAPERAHTFASPAGGVSLVVHADAGDATAPPARGATDDATP